MERFGLSNDRGFFGSEEAEELLYVATDFEAVHPFWCDFIEPTAICEGQSFISLNTFDRARFTFGFGQFAAHVPDGDFVRWFRDMLQRPEVEDYFPDLEVQAGRIVKVEEARVVPLEDSDSTEPLQLFLNPTLDDVEDAEVIAAAKLIHWTGHHPDVRLLQVQHMINTARRLVKEADRRLGLDGRWRRPVLHRDGCQAPGTRWLRRSAGGAPRQKAVRSPARGRRRRRAPARAEPEGRARDPAGKAGGTDMVSLGGRLRLRGGGNGLR